MEYSVGNSSQICEHAWLAKRLGGKTPPFGRKQPKAWGLYHTHRNIHERCQDWYGGYPSVSVTDPMGATSGSDRVNRGGSWDLTALNCRSTHRYGGLNVSIRFSSLGFRVCLSPSGQ